MVMPTYEPYNSTPTIWYPGTKDESGRAVGYVAPVLPMHNPIVWGFAPQGPVDARFGSASTHQTLYGKEIFDEKGRYGTIGTPFLNLFGSYANPVCFQRLIPEDAAPEARLCLALEIIETKNFRKIQRTASGDYQFDANARPVLSTDSGIDGVVAQWVILPTPSKAGIGTHGDGVAPKTGTMVYEHDATATSKIYPILEFQAQWIGEAGNNIGLRFSAPTKMSSTAPNLNVINDQKAFLYRIELVKRDNARTSPVTVKTNDDLSYTEFSLKSGAYDIDAGQASIDFEEIFLDHYRDFDTRGGKPVKYGNLGGAYVYRQNLEEVLTILAKVEKMTDNPSLGTSADGVEDVKHLMNIFTGRDVNNRPYNAVHIRQEIDGAKVSLNPSNTYYLTGGFDGTMNNEVYDELVRKELQYFGDMTTQWRDLGRYPIRNIYDFGFSTATKAWIFQPLTVRQDIHVTASTYDFFKDGPNKAPLANVESSRGFSLVQLARNCVESEIFGTGCCRANVIPQTMRLLNNPKYRSLVPMTYEVARMRCEYMSSPDGLIRGRGYDAPPYNHVREGKEVSNVYIPQSMRMTDWDNGMSHFLHKTDTVVFCPGLKTVYKDDTSVLTSDITVQIVCDLNYISFQVWAEMSGRSDLTDELFIATATDLFLAKVNARYDGRVVVQPEFIFSTLDKQRGYSWTTKIHLYAVNMKTVNMAYVITHRMEDLA